MLEVLLADPCRVIGSLLDYREIRRIWHKWRSSGTPSILGELSADTTGLEENCVDAKYGVVRDDSKLRAVLVIDAKIPQYDKDAGSRSSFLYLQLLREMGHHVYFMPNDQVRREPYARAIEDLGVQLILGSGFRCGRWKQWLRDHQNEVGNVVLHRPNVARRYLSELRLFRNMTILYLAHDLRCVRDSRHFQLTGDAFYEYEAEYWERIEKQIIKTVDRAYFFSEAECQLVASWVNGDKACTIPLFPLAAVADPGLAFEQRAGLLFVGGFTHLPNRDAVLWFASEVYPLIRSKIPAIEWHVVGANPPSEVLALATEGVIIEGAVSDQRLRLLYQSTKVVIAPLRFGAGVKGKILEAMHHASPTVTTKVGAEGIPESEGVLSICETPEEMARSIIDIYCHAATWMRIRERINNAAEKHLSRQAALSRLTQDLGRAGRSETID